MVGPDRLLGDAQRAGVDALGLLEPTGVLQRHPELVEDRDELGAWAELLFRLVDGVAQQHLRQSVAPGSGARPPAPSGSASRSRRHPVEPVGQVRPSASAASAANAGAGQPGEQDRATAGREGEPGDGRAGEETGRVGQRVGAM